MKSQLSTFSRLNQTRPRLRLAIVVSVSVFVLVAYGLSVTRANAAAGINKQINFQGKLVGSTGLNVTDGSYTVVFTLYDASSGGTNLWTETQTVTTTDGLFQVALGSVNTALGSVDFNSDSLYLGIKVGSDAEMTPRIRFAAVPYALNAQKVAGLTVTNTTGTLTVPNGKTISFGDAFTTSGANALTLTTTAATNITLPTTGTLLTNTASANQTITSSQASGSLLSLVDSTALSGNVTGQTITLSGSGAFDQTGLSFNLSNATGTNLNDIVGSGGSWKVSKTGALTVASCSGCGSGTNYWRINQGAFSTVNDTMDLLLGSNATASADFAFINMNAGTPTASISAASGNNATYLTGAGVLGTTNAQTLQLGSSSTGNIILSPLNGTGTVTVNGVMNLATGNAYQINGTSVLNATTLGSSVSTSYLTTVSALSSGSIASGFGTIATSNSITGTTLNATTGFATSGVQRIDASGNLLNIGTYNGGGSLTVSGDSKAITLAQTNLGGGAASNFVLTTTGGSATAGNQQSVLFQDNASTQARIDFRVGDQFRIGTQANLPLRFFTNGNNRLAITETGNIGIGLNNTSPLGTFDVRANSGTISVASVSGTTSFAGLAVDQSGFGDIVTASSSGLSRFRIANNGSVLFQGDSVASIGVLGNSAAATGIANDYAVANVLGDQGSLVPNAGFESALTGASFADGWVPNSTNSATLTRDNTSSAKGTASAKITTTAATGQAAAFYSTCIPLAGQGNYTLAYYQKASTANAATVRGYIDQYTSKANCQNNTSPTVTAPASTASVTTAYASVNIATPFYTGASNGWSTTTTWGRVHFYVTSPSTGVTVNIDGVRLIESTNTVGVDYAENYPVDPNNKAEQGDVVSLIPFGKASVVIPAARYMDQSAIGVVSTNPGEVLDDGTMGENKVPVALAGRIPTKVSTKNGAIHVGDYLTASDIPGVAVKAIQAGPVLGQAMEAYEEPDLSRQGKVVMFVKNTYYSGTPLTYNSGLSLDTDQGDLEFLGNLVARSQEIATASALPVTNTAGRYIAGLEVIAPKVTTDALQVNTITSAKERDITMQLRDGNFVIKNASGEATVKFDAQGNAFFAGTLSASGFTFNNTTGLVALDKSISDQGIRLAELEQKVATLSGQPSIAQQSPKSSTTTPQSIAADSLSVEKLATVSGSLRVQGNTLIEGILNVIDTMTVGNFIVDKLATFFADAVFNGDVFFHGTTYFNADTAGYVIVPAGQDHVEVKFTKPYKEEPVVNASAVTASINDEKYKQLIDEDICKVEMSKSLCEEAITKEALTKAMPYVIAAKSKEGFRVILSQPATQDLQFAWTAISTGKESQQ